MPLWGDLMISHALKEFLCSKSNEPNGLNANGLNEVFIQEVGELLDNLSVESVFCSSANIFQVYEFNNN